MRGPEDDHQLSLAAVGLWHRLASAATPVGRLELMTLAGDPTAFHPHGQLDDAEAALDELLAVGWVEDRGGDYVAARVAD